MTVPITIRPLGEPGDLGWLVLAHGEQYSREFGWNTEFEALVARIAADFADKPDPAGQAGWIAEGPDGRVGCVLCVPDDTETDVAKLRVLLVDPDARGHGLGGRLVDECLAFARAAGYQRMRLWTNDVLAAARQIYLGRGFVLVGEAPHHSFGADLIGQVYQREL
jgi:GNAT superfamily N-acetyltransferase